MDITTARAVGLRRRPTEVAILRVDEAAMTASGHDFYHSANGVWLAETVPPAFITRLISTGARESTTARTVTHDDRQ